MPTKRRPIGPGQLDGMAALTAADPPCLSHQEDVPSEGIIAISGGNGALGLVMGTWLLTRAEQQVKASGTELSTAGAVVVEPGFAFDVGLSAAVDKFVEEALGVNYSASNTCLDGLTRHRVSLGKPCTAIHWGAWGEVGMAATMDDVMRNRVMMGPMPYFTVAQGLQGLEGVGDRPGDVFIVNTPVFFGMITPDQASLARYMRNTSSEWLPTPIPSGFERENAYDIYRMYRYIFLPYIEEAAWNWNLSILPLTISLQGTSELEAWQRTTSNNRNLRTA
eukprot:Skav234686  [mRNA]  locus=scaffold3643:94075:102119:- [translate_table: standard]